MSLGSELDIVKMKMDIDEYDKIENGSNIKLDIIGTCFRNVGFGDGLQIRIEDYDIKEQQWYF